MKKLTGRERRIHPRLAQNLPIKVAVNGYDFSTATENISCVGAYCHITKYVPPFTKVAVKLSLPIATQNGQRTNEVKCKGVIVRTEDEESSGFNIAIFFNDIEESQKKKITQYIDQFLPKESCAH